ncbi:hypothetical protein RCH10_000468 [Variovorax sp. GrIS 2.14]
MDKTLKTCKIGIDFIFRRNPEILDFRLERILRD